MHPAESRRSIGIADVQGHLARRQIFLRGGDVQHFLVQVVGRHFGGYRRHDVRPVSGAAGELQHAPTRHHYANAPRVPSFYHRPTGCRASALKRRVAELMTGRRVLELAAAPDTGRTSCAG